MHFPNPEDFFATRKGCSWQEGRWVVDTNPDTYVTDENGETYGVDIDTRVMPRDENTLTPKKR